jgi:hypothetical protein
MGATLFTGGKPPEHTAPAAGGGTPPDDKPPADNTPPEGPVTVYCYRCVRACTFQKRYRKEGDIIELSEKRDIPHFVLIM